jgi:hypothetical protein
MYVAVAGPTGESRPWVVREADRVRMSVIVPFQPRAFHVVDRTGGFVTAYSSEYLLRHSSDGRDTVALFGRDWSPTAVSAEEKSRIAEQRVEELDVFTLSASDWPRSPWSPVAFGRDEVAVPLEGSDGRPLVRVFQMKRR